MINMPAGPEIMVILLLALLVLGPEQLPKAMRSFGNVMSEIRKVSSSFQAEMRDALEIMEDGIIPTEASEKTTAASTGSAEDVRPEGGRPGGERPDGVSPKPEGRDGAPGGPPAGPASGPAAVEMDPSPQEDSGAAASGTGDPRGSTSDRTDDGSGAASGPGRSIPPRPVVDPADRAAG